MYGSSESLEVNSLEEEVNDVVGEINSLMGAHAGGVELIGLDGSGRVDLRFTGMCTGCALRPLTFEAVVAPALRAIGGVSEIGASGTRISAEARERLLMYLGGGFPLQQAPSSRS